MTIAIRVPSVGESITEGTIVQWHRQNGDFIREADPLLELETEKATTTIPAPATGKLQITAREGAKVAIGTIVGQIDDSAAPAGDGRDTRLPKPAKPPAEAKTTDAVASTVAVKVPPPPASPPPSAATTIVPAPASATPGAERRQPMSAIRQRISERLLASQKTTATLTTFNEADMSAVMALRARYKETYKDRHQVPLGLMPFFVKAAVAAMKAVPIVNAFIDGSDVLYHDSYHIGVAVSTDKGLMVPVLRDAGRMSFAQIDRAIADLAVKARDGKIALTDLQGGTFTITNGGVFGSLLSTPILNPPQSAILGMHTIQKRPVVVDDQIVIRPMMYLALSYDHRLIDGREAVQWLLRLKDCVEHPERLLLEI
jgi:2-oxoglutarate dehydrogenase E2 component (dihydrolipoamide succinyltransferase)